MPVAKSSHSAMSPSTQPLLWGVVVALALNMCVLFTLTLAAARDKARTLDVDSSMAPLELFPAAPSEPPINELDAPPQNKPRVLEFASQNLLPPELFEALQPEFKALNGFSDVQDGGSAQRFFQTPRSGGGGGDAADALEFGHVVSDEKMWGRLKLKKSPDSETQTAGSENGVRDTVPGRLKNPGAGNGLGNGSESGALASQGSGRGAGAGANGAGSGNGLGTAAPLGATSRPRVLSMERGYYPPEARNARHEGTTVVTVQVLASGAVGKVELRTSSGYAELDQAALTAARAWQFTGALKNGQPVDFWYAIPFNFGLIEQR